VGPADAPNGPEMRHRQIRAALQRQRSRTIRNVDASRAPPGISSLCRRSTPDLISLPGRMLGSQKHCAADSASGEIDLRVGTISTRPVSWWPLWLVADESPLSFASDECILIVRSGSRERSGCKRTCLAWQPRFASGKCIGASSSGPKSRLL
jgi:hypothetical protein